MASARSALVLLGSLVCGACSAPAEPDAHHHEWLRQALGAAAERVPIASVLGQCGEWLTSAGARLGAALYALHEQALPGTTLCSEPDPAAALPGLVLTPRPATAPLRHVLVPVLAQGGGNAAIILSLDTAHIGRQVRFDPPPLLVAQPKQIPAHDPIIPKRISIVLSDQKN